MAREMIEEILAKGSVKLHLEGETKDEILDELVHLIEASEEEKNRLLNAVLEREAKMSTGVGKGVAIPRAKLSSLSGLRGAFGLKPEGIDFDALDGAPARIFFLLASPDGEDRAYVKTLSLLARIFNQDSFREDLLRARSEKEVLELFKEEEESR